ncbi:MAG: cell shape determination protein CcmA, partial [Limnobacter sp.]|nr:cell shape determination protein CcmA [Limnobacter sp.]
MFKKDKARKNTSIDSLIGPSVRLEGNVHFEGGLRIDGEINGKITTDDD